jgi:ligand-binding SRPBCC domain-containing protein
MRIYHLYRKQFLPITLTEAWSFFSSPKNLAVITPPYMRFKILYISRPDDDVYAGQLIRYTVGVMPGVNVHWVTEITHVNKPQSFIDEQRFGPYALWHHQHHFKEVAGGIEMTDEVNYAIPFGILGRLANWLFVGKKVTTIFDYRYTTLEKLFTKNELVIKRSA